MEQAHHTISDAVVQAFKRDGAICVRGLIPPQWLARLEVALEQIKSTAEDLSGYYGKAAVGKSLVQQQASETNQILRSFLFESPLARTAASLMRSQTVNLYEDLMIYKSAGAEQPTPWHQDEPQWPLTGSQMCSAWFCLDRVTGSSGALRFKAGSHNGPLYRPYAPANRSADLDADNHFFDGPLPDVAKELAHIPELCFDTEPGDIVLFHPRALHAAFGSAPDYARRTFSIRMIGEDVRWLPKKSVFYDWLKDIKLAAGDPIVDAHFPVLYSQAKEPV
jgi:ectoine hydroxylase-related dioxygenase (phytanoyl-CoA dioxygenase family)